MSGKIFIPIVTGFDKSGLNQATSALGRFGNTVQGIVSNIGGFSRILSSLGINKFVVESVNGARDLQRNFIALDTVFGEYGRRMQNFANRSEEFGLSSVESAKASVFLGSVLKQSGFEMSQVSDETEKLVKLASDLATTYGYDVSEALTGMTALFRGEYDPIEKFGVAMKQAEVNALLAARGQKNLTGEALRHAQAVARLELLYERASDAMGAFEKQGGNIFAAQKKLEASYKNLQARLGATLTQPWAEFLTLMKDVLGYLTPAFQTTYKSLERALTAGNALVPTLASMAKTVMNIINPIIDSLTSILSALVPIIAAIWKFFKPLFDAFTTILDTLNLIIKYIMIFVKILAIALLSLGKLFGMFLGAGFDQLGKGLANFFTDANYQADNFSRQLDVIIGQMTEIDKADITIDPRVLDPGLIRLVDEYNLKKAKEELNKWTDEQKKAFADLKNNVRASLLNLIPGALIERELGQFEQSVTDTYKNIFSQISQGVTDKVLSKNAAVALMNYAKKELDVLAKLARKRDELAKKYSLAKTLIADIRTATIGFANLSDIMGKVTTDITETITYVADKFTVSVTKSTKSMMTAKSLIDQYRDIVGRTRSFVADMKKLQSLNLNDTLFKQIVDAGLDSGSVIASALASGGATAVNELNTLYGELSDLGGQLGASTAEVMYGAGIDASKGLLKGIMSLDEKFKEAAKELAKSFSDSFNASLAARSGAGLKVDTSAAENLLSSASFGRASTSSSVVNVTVNAGIGTDGAAVGREIVTAIKKYERASGRVFAQAV